ncbi:MAG: hypothetical protein C0483_26455 [Pirellula sp.]|nr:hypothetical protein [Pirellula sp.]
MDDGFLSDPNGEHGGLLNPNAVGFEVIDESPCLILLGEPGIGKSTAVREQFAHVSGLSGRDALHFDLGEYGDERRLIDEIFGCAKFVEWSNDDKSLDLYLDSLDECRLQIPQVAKILWRQLERHRDKLSRLHLRITCRTADWPQSLTHHFCELWGKDVPKEYELTPLRQRDVVEAVAASGGASAKFLAEIARTGTQALAMKPVTLNFLLQTFLRDGRLPSNQVDVYAQGCLILCDENNPERVGAGQIGKHTPSDRLAVAERIAALTVLCNRPAVYFGPHDPEASSDCLTIDEIIGDAQALPASARPSADLVRETLASGLFSARGTQQVGFAHRTYAEYLAARYLTRTISAASRRLEMLQHHEPRREKIVPQLHETAAWAATLDEAVFDDIAQCDPQVLLKSDVAARSDAGRRDLLERLLLLAAQDQLVDTGWSDRSHYGKLGHSGLAEQLRSFINDSAKPNAAREFAVEVADECDAAQLASELADLALNDSEPSRLRARAVSAAVRLADTETKLRLKHFAISSATVDLNCELRTTIWRELWKSEISSAELFAVLEEPHGSSSSYYGFFLSHDLPKRLEVNDLPHALRWLASRTAEGRQEYHLRELEELVSRLGWKHSDDVHVRAAMVDYALAVLRTHHDVIPPRKEVFEADEQTRRMLTEEIVPMIDDFDRQGFGLIFQEPRLVRGDDVPWLLERLLSEANPIICQRWARLIHRVLDTENVAHLDAVLSACAHSAPLRDEYRQLLDGMRLASDEASQARQWRQQRQEMEQQETRRRNPPPLDPPPAVRIENRLQQCEAGRPVAWFDVARDLQLSPNSAHYTRELQQDLTLLPGWLNAEVETRDRIVRSAKQYLESYEVTARKWLGKNKSPTMGELWGYKAFVLLAKESPQLLGTIAPEVWARWAPVIITALHRTRKGRPAPLYRTLAKHCYVHAPRAVAHSLRLILRRSKAPDGPFILPTYCDVIRSRRLLAAMVREARNPELDSAVASSLFDYLFEHGSAAARKLAEEMLQSPLPAPGLNSWKRVHAATVALIRHAADAGWAAAWPAFKADTGFAREVLESLAHKEMRRGTLAGRLTESEVADLYIWLETQYPYTTDPQHDGAHFVSPRDAIASLRDEQFRALSEAGTAAAIEGLKRIQSTLPHLSWMPRTITEARARRLRKTWRPLQSGEILELTQNPQSYLVRSAAQLREVILESLQGLEAKLHDETPAVRDLWDKSRGDRWRPLEENEISDYIKRHLEQDLKQRGIVSLREVEIRRGTGHASGERTDIHVTGIVPGMVPGTFDQVRVIIEVKGQWHAEVKTAMGTQLVDRYLKNNSCHDGIYLVAWCRCPQWDSDDPRSAKWPGDTMQTLSDYLRGEAMRLSGSDVTIDSFVLNAALRSSS